MAAPMNLETFSSDFFQARRSLAYKTAKFDEISAISELEFFHDYLIPNKPCVFDPSVTRHWKSRQDWVLENGTPNFDFLKHRFGDAIVPVADCNQEEYSSHPKQDLTLCEYLDYWQDYRSKGYPRNEPCLYLKDWHFTKAFPDYEAYTTPAYFRSDWLNEFWDTRQLDDYRFVYMGPKGTWTPFHSDVYRSYSWSANICGKKKWIFYPPGCEDSLKDKFGNLIYDVTSPELGDLEKYPNSSKVKDKQLEVIQGQGQIIFVPSGWHHQVYNLEDTISINHNWLNGCNIDICWEHLRDNLNGVKREIADLRDMDGWEKQCQLILNASAGIDFATFIEMLKVIAQNRLEIIKLIDKDKPETASPHSKQCQGTAENVLKENNIASQQKPCIYSFKQAVDTRFLLKSSSELIDADCPNSNKSDGENIVKTCFISKGADHLEGTADNVLKENGKVGAVTIAETCNTCKYEDPIEENEQSLQYVDQLEMGLENKHATFDTHEFKRNEDMNNTKDGLNCFSNGEGVKDKLTANVTCDKDKITRITTEDRVCDSSSKCDNDKVDIIEQKWYILFDLFRIQETLQNIMLDEDYKKLDLEKENSAEYVNDLILQQGIA